MIKVDFSEKDLKIINQNVSTLKLKTNIRRN